MLRIINAGLKRMVLAGTLAVFGVADAAASAIQVFSSADLAPGFRTAVYPEPEGTLLPSPYILNTGDNVFTYSLDAGGTFLRGDISGTRFLYNGAILTGPSPVTISFATPLSEVGTTVLSNTQGNTTFTFTLYNSAAVIGTFTRSGPYASGLFLGAEATGGDVITRMSIASNTNDFLMCPCAYANTVPEPATMGLIGLPLLVALAWRRIRLPRI